MLASVEDYNVEKDGSHLLSHLYCSKVHQIEYSQCWKIVALLEVNWKSI